MPIFPLIIEGVLTTRLGMLRCCKLPAQRSARGLLPVKCMQMRAICHGEKLSTERNALTLNSLIITLHFSVNFVKILDCFENCSVLRRQFYFCKFPASREVAL